MPTSAQYAYTVNLTQMVAAIFRVLGVYNTDSPVPATDYANCVQAINLMIKNLMAQGTMLWCVEDIVLPLVQGQGDSTNPYILGPGGAFTTYKPLKVQYARLRYGTSQTQLIDDVQLIEVSRNEYNMLGNKLSQGAPNTFYFDPQTTFANFQTYCVADAYNATYNEIILTVHRPLQDMINTTDNFDVPIECLNVIKYCGAAELLEEYDIPDGKAARIMAKAGSLMENMFSFSQEEASTYFSPDYTRR